MSQHKSQTMSVENTSAAMTCTEAANIDSTEATSVSVADHSNTAGEAASPVRGKRSGTARPKQAGKGKGETRIGSNQGNPKPSKKKAQADGGAASKAKSKAEAVPSAVATPSKLDQLVALLRKPGGATLPELQSATGWQVHSVRGAMAGSLRKKGYSIASEKPKGGLRHYRIAEAT